MEDLEPGLRAKMIMDQTTVTLYPLSLPLSSSSSSRSSGTSSLHSLVWVSAKVQVLKRPNNMILTWLMNSIDKILNISHYCNSESTCHLKPKIWSKCCNTLNEYLLFSKKFCMKCVLWKTNYLQVWEFHLTQLCKWQNNFLPHTCIVTKTIIIIAF